MEWGLVPTLDAPSLLDVFPDGSIGRSSDLLWRSWPSTREEDNGQAALRHLTSPHPSMRTRVGSSGANRTAPGVVHAVARGTKRPIRKRRAREGTNDADDDADANRERAKDRGRERADDEEKERNEDEEADAGRWTREVGAAAEAESPSDETDAAIRKELVKLGLPLGSSVVGRYVIDFTSPLTRQRWAFGIIVGYDKGKTCTQSSVPIPYGSPFLH